MRRTLIIAVVAVLALAGSAAAATFASGSYSGKTSQGGPIKLLVKKNTLKSVAYSAEFSCTTQSGKAAGKVVQSTKLPAMPIKHGQVNKVFKLGGGTDDIKLIASFKGRKVTGRFTEVYLSNGGNFCASGTVKFTAKH